MKLSQLSKRNPLYRTDEYYKFKFKMSTEYFATQLNLIGYYNV